MKISSIYYLDYPDGPPEDPLMAHSEMRVEVGEGEPTIGAFDYTYAFNVYTIGFLQEALKSGRKYIIDPATIVVERFDYALVREAVASVLDRLDQYGQKVD